MKPRRPSRQQTNRAFSGRLGFPLGLVIAVLVTAVETVHQGLPLPRGLWIVQRGTPWLWVLDTLPVVLGLFGTLISGRSAELRFTNKRGPWLFVACFLMFLVPISLMLYAYQENRNGIQALSDTRRAGELQTLSLQLYIRTTQRPGADIRADLTRMAQLRKEIKQTALSALTSTEPAWQTFQREGNRTGKISFTTALHMRDAAAKLTHALETDARLARNEAGQILLIGVLGTLFSVGLTLQLISQLRKMEEQLVTSNKQQIQTNKQLEAANEQFEEANKRLEEANVQLERTAARDPVTGLYNRRALDERLLIEWNRAVRYQEPITIILLDLDHFKSYNDSFGHPAGDAVLKTIGALLQHGTRISDFPARYGGEEFVIVLPHTAEEEAARLAERIRAAIQAAPWKHRAITASIGVAARTDSMVQPSELIDAADVALYQAKKTRNRVSRHTTALSARTPFEQEKKAA